MFLLFYFLYFFSFSGEAEDEHATEYIEDTNKDAVMIAAVPWVVSDRISKAKVCKSYIYISLC